MCEYERDRNRDRMSECAGDKSHDCRYGDCEGHFRLRGRNRNHTCVNSHKKKLLGVQHKGCDQECNSECSLRMLRLIDKIGAHNSDEIPNPK